MPINLHSAHLGFNFCRISPDRDRLAWQDQADSEQVEHLLVH